MSGLAAVAGRVRMMLARAVIALVDDGRQAQALQLDLLADETHEGVERFAGYGFTSVPHPGAEALVAFVGGLRSHGVVIQVEDRRYRLTGLEAGEVAIFDDLGQAVHLKRTGIEVRTTGDVDIQGVDVTIHATNATVLADRVDLGGADGQRVARIGDTVSGGVITGGSTKVFAA